eukprot:CAMPEP_0115021574 /NCGR_PEP_ID=MMETSP0216-20121206/30979_1 /TAXON_ID=223996 /ORGANISM="Protocruzia adherens, Strain Boccale" /LENGTH=474 /DNA_ID=CAMNT_0002393979 /DNA_START=51 /DNA_END=1475 /DNA_ORIENTATION=+
MADDIPAKDLIFEDKTDETLIKKPGEILGNDFMILNLENCDVYLLDFTAQITIDDCVNCRFLIGPCEGSIFFRDCKNIKVTAACAQFRLRDVTDSDFCLYSTSEPSIETSTNVKFGPFNGGYPHLDEHFRSAKLETTDNKWSQIFDFNKPEEGRNWGLLNISEFQQENYKAIDGMSAPINPVGLPIQYGGSVDEPFIVGAQGQAQDGDMMSFNIQTDQGNAQDAFQKQEDEAALNAFNNDQNENAQEEAGFDFAAANTNDVAGNEAVEHDGGFDMFGATATTTTTADVETSNPFGDNQTTDNTGNQFTNFGGDDLGAAGTTAANNMDDVFGGAAGGDAQKLDWQPDDISLATSEYDEEEIERVAQRNKEHEERMQRLMQKDEDERAAREEKRAKAREALEQWKNEREEGIQKQNRKNKEEEWNTTQTMNSAKESSNPWEVITMMIDMKESNYKGEVDVSRMKEAIIGKKNDFTG